VKGRLAALSFTLLVRGMLFFYMLARPELVLMVNKPGDQQHPSDAKNQDQQL
jgi:hypothetical protein